MGRPRAGWRDGRRAVERLVHWYTAGRRTGADPLAALSEIGTVRRLLDEVELEAVRSARRLNRSWAEIATELGVSRQSAWERWRDLDVGAAAGPANEPPETDEPGTLELPEAVRDRAAAPAVRAGRRRARVPSVVGMTFLDARERLAEHRLVGIHHDLAPAPADDADAVVTDQTPEPGARVPAGSPVRLWTGRGGGPGVREPRRPRPTSLPGRKAVDDPQDEAVG